MGEVKNSKRGRIPFRRVIALPYALYLPQLRRRRFPQRPRQSGAARAHGADRARRLRGAVDDLWHHRQGQPGPALRHDRGGGLVARSVVRLSQASAAGGLDRVGVVRRLSARRVVLLSAGDADAGDRAVVFLAAVGGLSRHRKAHHGAGAAHAGAVLQFPCAEIQRQHRSDAGVGGDHLLVPAILPDAQRALRRARGLRRRRLHAGQILVGVSAAGLDRRRAGRRAPRQIFPLAGGRGLPPLSASWCWRRISFGWCGTTSCLSATP